MEESPVETKRQDECPHVDCDSTIQETRLTRRQHSEAPYPPPRHICRICLQNEGETQLVSPCSCKGNLKYIHVGCLEEWLRTGYRDKCELCESPYRIYRKLKSLHRWRLSREDCKDLFREIVTTLFIIVIWALVWYLLTDYTHGFHDCKRHYYENPVHPRLCEEVLEIPYLEQWGPQVYTFLMLVIQLSLHAFGCFVFCIPAVNHFVKFYEILLRIIRQNTLHILDLS